MPNLITPDFIETQRRDMMNSIRGATQGDVDNRLADFLAMKMAEGGESDTFVQDLQDVRRATRDTRAISALLDRYAYGTANPTERFTPEAEQEPKGFLERFKDSTQGGITIPVESGGVGAVGRIMESPIGKIIEAPTALAGSLIGKGLSKVTGVEQFQTRSDEEIREFAEKSGKFARFALPVGAGIATGGASLPIMAPASFTAGALGKTIQELSDEEKQDFNKIIDDAVKEGGVDALIDVFTFGMGGKLKSFIKAKTLKGLPIDEAIDTGIAKGVKPTVIGKKTVERTKQFMEKARKAVKSIVARSDDLKLTNESGEQIIGETPKTLFQFAEAIDQTKKTVFRQYRAMAEEASQRGVTISTDNMIKLLDEKVIANTALRDTRPEVVKHAMRIRDRLAKRGAYLPEEADEVIKEWNSSLRGFFAGTTADRAKAEVEGSLAKVLRKELDDAIESAVGEGFQPLKNEYGALRAIEEEVAKRAIVNARKSAKGLFDLSDVFTGGELVSGILTQNPASIIRGAVGRGTKEWFKFLNDPDRIIKTMFDTVQSAATKKAPARALPKGVIPGTVKGIVNVPDAQDE